MSGLDVLQIVVFAFVAIVNVWSLKVSREHRALKRQLLARKAANHDHS